MPIRISNLRMGLDEPEAHLGEELARTLQVPAGDIRNWRILRKSLDARQKDSFHYVYTAEVELGEEEPRVLRRFANRGGEVRVEPYEDQPFTLPPPGEEPLEHPPVIVGSGPAGLVAGYFLAEAGYQPIILERGRKVRERIHDVQAFDSGGAFEPESNYLFGEGGAGTFSDGKLTCRGSGPEVRRVLELFAASKGKSSVVYDYRPHLGSNRLPAVVKSLRRQIEAFGGEIRFQCKVEDLDLVDGLPRGVQTSSGYQPANLVLLAIGHSARDTMTMLLKRGVPMEQKAFQMGVRIEQPQAIVNRVKYGSAPLEDKLGAADYNLVAKGKNDLFTFCMCAGGYIIPSVSEEGYFCTNGMSLSTRASPFANSGLVVTIPTSEFGGADVLAGVRLQEVYERKAFGLSGTEYRCPIQLAKDFLSGRVTTRVPPCSYPRGLVLTSIADLVPPVVLGSLQQGLPLLDRKWQGRFLRDATLVGPEARGSCPIRMNRTVETRESPGITGLYPVGEGAGYAGGIVSAAVDGLRTALAILRRYRPLRR